jgi:Tol biopolymer transport system component
MEHRSICTGIILAILLILTSHAQHNDFPILKGPYLGQKPPGMTPELFVPGMISTKGPEFCITFSGDGRECYFQRGREILVTRERNGSWTPPEIAPFSGKYPDGDPFLSPDGEKLFFTSERPVRKKGTPKNDTDMWYVQKEGQKWSVPCHLGNQINTKYHERTPSVALDGTLYFHVFDRENPCDLYYSHFENGRYTSPKPVVGLNTDTWSEADACISPHKEYIVFLQNGISISFADKNGEWKTPIRLKDMLGPQYENTWPRVSSDGKYLFFSSFRPDPHHPNLRSPNIYWVSFEAILKKTNHSYFGQKPPGITPEVFAPGVISTEDHIEFAGTFSPDFKQFFFTRRKKDTIDNRIYHVKFENSKLTKPELAPFAYDCFEFEPHISPDGGLLFYGSRRPLDDTCILVKGTNIWVVRKTSQGWSKPEYWGPPFNEAMFVCMAEDGTMYNSGISKSEPVNGKYGPWEKIALHLHGPYMHPCIGPDESFIIFDTDHSLNGRGKSLLISFRQPDGSWGEIISFRELDPFCKMEKFGIPMLTPDKKYLFFSSKGDIYWVDAKIIEQLRDI